MAHLYPLGIGPTDAKLLIDEYSYDLEWFVDRLQQVRELMRIRERAEDAEVLAVVASLGTKSNQYPKWIARLMERAQELSAEGETLFDRLKRAASEGTNTLFDKLKRFREED